MGLLRLCSFYQGCLGLVRAIIPFEESANRRYLSNKRLNSSSLKKSLIRVSRSRLLARTDAVLKSRSAYSIPGTLVFSKDLYWSLRLLPSSTCNARLNPRFIIQIDAHSMPLAVSVPLENSRAQSSNSGVHSLPHYHSSKNPRSTTTKSMMDSGVFFVFSA